MGELMASFGDERNLLVWMQYRRWPFIAAGFSLVGLIIGVFLQGLIGAVVGLFAGAVFGAVIGKVIGRNKTMFPVIVEVWVKYGGAAPRSPVRYPGRVNVRQFGQESGPPVEDVRIEYLQGTMIRRMPNFGPPVWDKEGETPILRVVQIDRIKYLPMSWNNGRMVIHRVPVYLTQQVVGKDGKPTFVYPRFKGKEIDGAWQFDKDELGGMISDENGMPYITRYEDVVAFDFNKMQDITGKVVDVPTGLAAELNNDRAEFTQAWSIMSSLYEMSNWWKENKGLVFFVLTIAGMLISVYWAFDSINHSTDARTKSDQQFIDRLGEQNLEIARLNAQVASAFLKAGWNSSAAFVYGPMLINGTGQQVGQPTPALSIPFIS